MMYRSSFRYSRPKVPSDETLRRANAFAAQYPKECAFLRAKAATGNSFFVSVENALKAWGSLTPNQLAVVQKNLAREEERAATPPVKLGDGFAKILEVMSAAKASGLKRPVFRTKDYSFRVAPWNGANPDCVYVTTGACYVGKISPDGSFENAGGNGDSVLEKRRIESLLEVCADPMGAAVAFGRLTRECSCCGRPLDNPLSVKLGIGPVCRKRYFPNAA